MLPDKANKIWKQLVTGQITHNFKCVSAGLMLSRIKRDVEKNNSEENINKYVDDVYVFFQKYQSILQDDMKIIFK